MSTQMPFINTTILKWARNEAGLSLNEAAQRAGIRALKPRKDVPGQEPGQRLEQWEKGIGTPSFRQLTGIAKAYRRPVLTFFLPAPPKSDTSITDYRTLGDHSADLAQSPEFAALVRRVEALQERVHEMVVEAGGAPVELVGSGTTNEPIKEAATSIREFIRFPLRQQQKINNGDRLLAELRKQIESVGVFVLMEGDLGSYHSKIPPTVFRGIAISDKYAPFIVVNPNDSHAARVFTLVHELVHIWLGDTGVSNLNHLSDRHHGYIDRERYCNQVTTEFLVPSEHFVKLWGDGVPVEHLYNFIKMAAKTFKASEICIARRMLGFRMISDDFYWSFYRSYEVALKRIKEKQQDSESGPDPTIMKRFRLGGRLVDVVMDATHDGRISELDASQLLRVKINKFQELVSDSA